VMCDLDHFKELNDTFGHETGDRALRLFAQTLASTLRSQDLVCRYGGEEFALVLPSCSAADACRALEMVRGTLGLEAFENEDLPGVLGRADAALFEAKEQGRNRIVVHPVASVSAPVVGLRESRKAPPQFGHALLS